jgi:hypothetical protein
MRSINAGPQINAASGGYDKVTLMCASSSFHSIDQALLRDQLGCLRLECGPSTME